MTNRLFTQAEVDALIAAAYDRCAKFFDESPCICGRMANVQPFGFTHGTESHRVDCPRHLAFCMRQLTPADAQKALADFAEEAGRDNFTAGIRTALIELQNAGSKVHLQAGPEVENFRKALAEHDAALRLTSRFMYNERR